MDSLNPLEIDAQESNFSIEGSAGAPGSAEYFVSISQRVFDLDCQSPAFNGLHFSVTLQIRSFDQKFEMRP